MPTRNRGEAEPLRRRWRRRWPPCPIRAKRVLSGDEPLPGCRTGRGRKPASHPIREGRILVPNRAGGRRRRAETEADGRKARGLYGSGRGGPVRRRGCRSEVRWRAVIYWADGKRHSDKKNTARRTTGQTARGRAGATESPERPTPAHSGWCLERHPSASTRTAAGATTAT